MTLDDAIERWGEDPHLWPMWLCTACPQFHSGWALGCDRCGRPRSEVDGTDGPAVVDGPRGRTLPMKVDE